MTTEQKAKRFEELLTKAKQIYNKENDVLIIHTIEDLFPELKISEDEKIRKCVKYAIDKLFLKEKIVCDVRKDDVLAWLEKQGECETDCHRSHQDANHPNGCIVFEDFSGAEGFYKVHIDYLNKKQVEVVEEMVRTWNNDSKAPDEDIKSCIGMCLTDANEQRFKDYNTSLKDCLAWLEKQGGKEYPQVYEIKDGENKHICELNNSYTCVKFPFKAKVKSSGKIVTIQGGQLSPDGSEWRKYQSDAEDGYKVYEPNNLEID